MKTNQIKILATFLFVSLIPFASTRLVAAQHDETPSLISVLQDGRDPYDSEAWQRVSFKDRERIFEQEARDPVWAPAMEQAIREKVAEFDRPLEEVFGSEICSGAPMCQEKMPSVLLISAECRWALCMIEMRWPPNTVRSVIGQQVSFLYGLGIDHQGETQARDDDIQYLLKLIARRRN